MKKYQPEIGQALFGQPTKQLECPEYVVALLESISNELGRVMWNIKQEEYASPFGNTGNRFKNGTFEVQAYSWDEEVVQPFNFKWQDVEISWYKYLGRGCSINRPITKARAVAMFNDCIRSIRKMDKEL